MPGEVVEMPGLISRTIASKHNIKIPEGTLFYPCCGNDTGDPIKLFYDSISEFYFVDRIVVPELPKLGIEVKGYQEECTYRGRNHKNRTSFLPIGLVSEAYAKDPYEDKIDNYDVDVLMQKGIVFAGYNRTPGKIYEQIWNLQNIGKSITIKRHIQDGLAAFISLGEISIFFLRRDSSGEGGSGQFWFQEKIFNLILDKLLDGGLIVTDGSGYRFDFYETVKWRNLWCNRVRQKQLNNEKPNDFLYRERQFHCLEKVGEGYGPVYIWQVSRL